MVLRIYLPCENPRWCQGCRRRCTQQKHTKTCLQQIEDKTNIPKLIMYFQLFWNSWIPLSCFGQLVFLHVIDIREVRRMFGSSKSQDDVFLLSLHPALHDMAGVCSRSISTYMFLQNFRWWSQNCRWTRRKSCHLCWELQVHDSRQMTILYWYGIHMSYWFVLCGLNLRSLPIILILWGIPSWEP